MANEAGLKNLDASLAQLESVVKDLEAGNLTIDEAIDKYSEGMQLAVECRRNLNDMSKRVAKVRQSAMQQINALNQEESEMQNPSA